MLYKTDRSAKSCSLGILAVWKEKDNSFYLALENPSSSTFQWTTVLGSWVWAVSLLNIWTFYRRFYHYYQLVLLQLRLLNFLGVWTWRSCIWWYSRAVTPWAIHMRVYQGNYPLLLSGIAMRIDVGFSMVYCSSVASSTSDGDRAFDFTISLRGSDMSGSTTWSSPVKACH